jgi:hypothetical protein
MDLNTLRKELNPRQKALREALTKPELNDQAIPRFLTLHGILHAAEVAPEAPWSYEDRLLDGLSDDQFRIIPTGEEHSLTWIIWHLSRIEDLAMNLLVAKRDQVFTKGDWQGRMQSPIKHTGNGTSLELTTALSEAILIPELRAYRHAVGRATREVVQALSPREFNRKMAPAQLQRIIDEGGVAQEGLGVVEYWGGRTVAGLLLMPPTRHTIIHWNEARRIINKIS